MKFFTKIFAYTSLALFAASSVSAQQKTNAEQKAAYWQVVTQRAEKIVKPMGLTGLKQEEVRDIIAQQYVDLNTIHDSRNAAVKQSKEKHKTDKGKAEPAIKKLEAKADKKLARLHKKYISKLSARLSPEQVDVVKNGMTYNVLPNTYKGYQEMLPNITAEQRAQILAYLTEAREHAMDAESSEKKHAWFGRYKGKINNYLSTAGIDMNTASKEWQQRIRDEEAKKKSAQ